MVIGCGSRASFWQLPSKGRAAPLRLPACPPARLPGRLPDPPARPTRPPPRPSHETEERGAAQHDEAGHHLLSRGPGGHIAIACRDTARRRLVAGCVLLAFTRRMAGCVLLAAHGRQPTQHHVARRAWCHLATRVAMVAMVKWDACAWHAQRCVAGGVTCGGDGGDGEVDGGHELGADGRIHQVGARHVGQPRVLQAAHAGSEVPAAGAGRAGGSDAARQERGGGCMQQWQAGRGAVALARRGGGGVGCLHAAQLRAARPWAARLRAARLAPTTARPGG